MSKPVILSALLLFMPIAAARAQAPDSIGFQGYLTDNLGEPLDSSGVVMTLKLYKGNTVVYTDTHHVTVSNGVFNVLIGKNGDGLDTVAFNQAVDLGITLNGEGTEMTPRTPLVSAAYARALPGLYSFYRDTGHRKAYNLVGGGPGNVVGADVTGAVIGGGGGIQSTNPQPNSVLADYGTVSGGRNNTAGGFRSTVSGGDSNTASAQDATIGGGFSNTAASTWSTVAGGTSNMASGSLSTVCGGSNNTASGQKAVVPGGRNNIAGGESSFAAGTRAHAIHNGAFVWQDTSGTSIYDPLESSVSNQFLARASGGFRFLTSAAPFDTSGAELAAGSGSWASLSSEVSKTAFFAISRRDYLDRVASLELKKWSYRTEPGVTHVGPMAEDFYAAFGLGPNEHSITSVDADGVALAAIQGLYELVKEQQAVLAEQQAELDRMRGVMLRAGLE